MGIERHLLENCYVALPTLPMPDRETERWVTIEKGAEIGKSSALITPEAYLNLQKSFAESSLPLPDNEKQLLFTEITKEQRELINSLIALSNSKPELKEQAEGLLKTVGKKVYFSKVGAGVASLMGYEYVGKLVYDEIYIKHI